MNRIIKIYSLLIFLTMASSARAQSAPYVLKGLSTGLSGATCYLYVDRVGYNRLIPGPHKFYAEVRTSFEPNKTLLMISHPASRYRMVSINAFGRPSLELGLQLRGPATEQNLWRTFYYEGGAVNRFNCHQLRPDEKAE